MPTTWEWGPLATGMEEEAVRRQKIAEEEGRMARQGMAQQSAMDVARSNRAAALEQMIQGKQLDVQKAREMQGLKEAATEREYQAEIPLLRAMLEGNPEFRKTTGMAGTMPTPQMEPGVYGTAPRPVSEAELRGLAPLMKNAFPTLLQKSLEGPQKPFPVTQGAGVWNPTKGQWDVEPTVQPRPFPTSDAALAEEARVHGLYPKTVGHTSIDQDIHGNYQLKIGKTAPLTPSLYQDIYAMTDTSLSPEARKAAGVRVTEYSRVQGNIQGIKTRESELNKAVSPDVQKYIADLAIVENNQKELAKFSDVERQAFIGPYASPKMWSQNVMANFPVAGPLIKRFGTPEALRQRYEDFQALHGAQHQLVFGVGGKQLTVIEERIAGKNIPSGEERSIQEYQAKERYFRRYLEAHKIAATEIKMSRGDVTPEIINDIAKRATERAGVSDITTNPNAWKKELSPKDQFRLRHVEGEK